MVPLEHNGRKPNPFASLSLLWKLTYPKINLRLKLERKEGGNVFDGKVAHNEQRFMEMMQWFKDMMQRWREARENLGFGKRNKRHHEPNLW